MKGNTSFLICKETDLSAEYEDRYKDITFYGGNVQILNF